MRKRLHQLTRRWVVGVVAAVAVLFLATLIVTGPAARPRQSPGTGTSGILAATRSWTVTAALHGPGGPGAGAPASLQLGSIACTSGGRACVAVGGPFVARRPAGGAWHVQAAPAAVGYLTSVSCAGPADCLAVAQPSGGAVGDLAMSSADGGASWTPHALPAAVEGLSGVGCAGGGDCTAVGEGRHGAVVATTRDGGGSWQVAPAPAGLGGLDAVGCAPSRAALCVAVGWLRGGSSAAIAVLGSGVVDRAPAGVGALDSVSCPTASTCLVGGFLTPAGGAGAGGAPPTRRFPGAVARSSDGGRHWALLHLPAGAGPVNALSCVGAAGCVAAGVSASPAAKPAAGTAAGGRASAPSAGAAAAGPPGMAVTTADGGSSWQVDRLPGTASGLASVACMPAAGAGGLPACVATAAGPQASSLVLAGG